LAVGISLIFTATSSISHQSATKESRGPDEPVAFIDAITFEGATTVSDDVKATIAGALRGETRRSDWLKKFQAKAQRKFQEAGFLDATVIPKINASHETDGVAHVTMLVAVTEGRRYCIESIKWTGSSPISKVELEHLSNLHVGDIFSFTSVGTTVSSVTNELVERGFRSAVIAPSFNKSPETARVTLYLEVIPGERDTNFRPPTCHQPSVADVRSAPFVPSTTYDPKRSAQLDIARAEVEAERTHKKVLIFVGGEWCAPCMALEHELAKNPNLTALLSDTFVVVHVNATQENTSPCTRKNLPNGNAYPWVYVLDANGKVLASHNPADWQSFEGFDSQRIESFLRSGR
jgi:thiol-disulfide isomerase/thioredoxin